MTDDARQADRLRRRALLRAISFIGSALAVGFGAYFVAIRLWPAALLTFVSGALYIGTIVSARRPGWGFTAFAAAGFAVSLVGMFFVVRDFGGIASPLLSWIGIAPMVAWSGLGRRAGLVVAATAVAVVVALLLVPPGHIVDPELLRPMQAVTPLLVLITTVSLVAWIERVSDASFAELAATNAALARARDEADRANRARSEFVATVSHELRTPLAAIIGTTDLLSPTTLDARQREHVQIARAAAASLLVLVDDLLDASLIDAQRLTMHAVPTDITSLTRSVAGLFSRDVVARGLRFDLALPAGPVWVLVDPSRVRQVMTNLLSNAVKFTATGHVSLTLRAQPRDGATLIEITVSDSGIGIPPEHVPRIFERFRQGDSSTTRRFGGTGLGLSIARDLVDLMGGSIEVRSAPGAGSTFTISFAASTAPATDVPPLDLHGVRVLVADDNPVNRRLAALLLEGVGAAVDVAADGVEAVRLTGERRYDVVLLDCYMPEMDGFRAASEMRGRGVSSPILAVTAAGTGDIIAQARAAGMDDLLTKPIDLEAIRASLGRVSRRGAAGPG